MQYGMDIEQIALNDLIHISIVNFYLKERKYLQNTEAVYQ